MASALPAVEPACLVANKIGRLAEEYMVYIIICNYGTMGSPTHPSANDARIWAAPLQAERTPAPLRHYVPILGTSGASGVWANSVSESRRSGIADEEKKDLKNVDWRLGIDIGDNILYFMLKIAILSADRKG
jgi:hypothetical protein